MILLDTDVMIDLLRRAIHRRLPGCNRLAKRQLLCPVWL